MKRFYGILAACFTFAACTAIDVPSAEADVTRFYWTPPTQYVNGTPIPTTETLYYRIYCGAQGDVSGSFLSFVDVGTGNETSIDTALPNATPGIYQCALTAYLNHPCDNDLTNPDIICESPYSDPVTAWRKGNKWYKGSEPENGMLKTRK